MLHRPWEAVFLLPSLRQRVAAPYAAYRARGYLSFGSTGGSNGIIQIPLRQLFPEVEPSRSHKLLFGGNEVHLSLPLLQHHAGCVTPGKEAK